MSQVMHPPMSKEMEQCIKDCESCNTICWESMSYCIDMGAKYADPSHLRSMMDCAEICKTCADFMLRGSEMYQPTCTACAEVCDRCEQSCMQFGDDSQMKACAAICRRTAESCRTMAAVKAMRRAA